MSNTGTYTFIDASGRQQEVTLNVTVYKEANDHGMSLSQYLERKYPSDPSKGTTFSQFMQSAGIILRPDPITGLKSPTMKDVLEGNASIMAGPLVRNDGSDRLGIAGRLLFPQVMLELVASALTTNYGDFLGGYNQMVAITTNVTSNVVDQPTITTTGPEESRSQPISQLAEPAVMVNITVGEKTFRIPHKAIGLLVSAEAMEATTIDQVGLAVEAQARGEQIYMIEEQIGAMVNGDADWGETALSSITAASLDSTIDAAGEITQKAWIHYLHDNYRTISINWLMMNLDTAMAIENRAGKPTVMTDDPNSPRIDALVSFGNLNVQPPKIFTLDTDIIGANTIVGIDSRYAIQRVINVNASYQAVEEWVMRRATAMRFDYGQMSKKLYTAAWKKMTLTV